MAQPLVERVGTAFGIATGAFVTERDDWPAAIERARGERWRWLELTALRGRLGSLLRFLDARPDALEGFERVSVHAPAKTKDAPADVVGMVESLPFDVVLHRAMAALRKALALTSEET